MADIHPSRLVYYSVGDRPEVIEAAQKDRIERAVRPNPPETRPGQPFGGKGDHDGDGKPGGAKKPVKKAK